MYSAHAFKTRGGGSRKGSKNVVTQAAFFRSVQEKCMRQNLLREAAKIRRLKAPMKSGVGVYLVLGQRIKQLFLRVCHNIFGERLFTLCMLQHRHCFGCG